MVTLTSSQERAFDKICAFASGDDKVFILKGFAGSGKTTLVKAVIKRFHETNQRFTLLATTGRAAKVLNDSIKEDANELIGIGATAITVHSLIYTYSDINQDLDLFSSQEVSKLEVQNIKPILLQFKLRQQEASVRNMIYLVDESSMISDKKEASPSQALYGEDGRLLSDLLSFDPNGKFIFIGDACQLPPINQNDSPALSAAYFKNEFDIQAAEAELTDIVRQSKDNDIPLAAARIRAQYQCTPMERIAKFPFRGYRHIHILNSEYEMLERYIDCIRDKDYGSATMIVMSNKSVVSLSKIIRPAIGFSGRQVCEGDLLLVTQNNMLSRLMNGDLIKVLQLGLKEYRAGLTFQHVLVQSLSTGETFSQYMIEEILYSGGTNLTSEQQSSLMIDFHIRMKTRHIKQSSPEYEDAMRRDSYLNALRCTFGYALTCHKSQGGEWDKVFLVIPRGLPYSNPRRYAYQWVYTAMTRAKKELYVLDDYWVQ